MGAACDALVPLRSLLCSKHFAERPGRTEKSTLVPKTQAAKQQPAEMQTPPAPQAPESQATALVEASKTYANAVVAAEKAISVVADLERRLEFARENAVETINEKDKALQQIKILIGEQS